MVEKKTVKVKPKEAKATTVKKKGKGLQKKKIPTPKTMKKIKSIIQQKSNHLFKGRFGQRPIRKASIKKWQKWRYPRGIDIGFEKEDGPMPTTGWRTPKSIRYRHPSGFYEELVNNLQQVVDAAKSKDTAVRIAGTVGKRKRIQIIEKANELGVKVLN